MEQRHHLNAAALATAFAHWHELQSDQFELRYEFPEYGIYDTLFPDTRYAFIGYTVETAIAWLNDNAQKLQREYLLTRQDAKNIQDFMNQYEDKE